MPFFDQKTSKKRPLVRGYKRPEQEKWRRFGPFGNIGLKKLI
jgi:hypothetical protein